MRLVGLVALVAVVVGMATGCGGSQDSTESEASPPAETGLELLQRSNKVMANVGSFRSRMTVEGISLSQEIAVSVETDVGENQWTHTRMSIESPDDATEIVEQVVTGEHAYTKVSGQDPTWIRTDLRALAQLGGMPSQSRTDPLGFYNILFPVGSLPEEAYTVKSVGLRRIFGVKSEHLTVELDFQEAWASLNRSQQQQLQQSLALDHGAGELIEGLQYESIDIWIDVSGYVRQLKMAISAADDTSLEIGMVLTDFGKQIDIQEPKEYVDVP